MRKNRENHEETGFTLLEVILFIALIGILAGTFFSVFTNFQITTDLDLASLSLVQSLRRAQFLAQGVFQDSDWGVKTESERITIFKGASFSGRDASQDEIIDFPSALEVSGNTEIVFEKLSGEPDLTGLITLSTTSGTNREISLNEKGTISY